MSGDKQKTTDSTAEKFATAALHPEPRLLALVQHLARITAEKDYKALTDSSNPSYDQSKTRGLKHD